MTALCVTLFGVFALDRAAKWAALRRLGRDGRCQLGLFGLRLVRNPRPRSWPSGSARSWACVWLAAFAGAVGILWFDPLSGAGTALGLGAALGGALGNVYDRLRHGAVLDFLDAGRWGIFNPADAALAIGLGVVVFVRGAALASLLVNH